jgi:hypothetical protein
MGPGAPATRVLLVAAAGALGALALAGLFGLLVAAFSGAVGGGAAAARAEPAPAARVVGLAECGAAVLTVTPGPARVGGIGHHRIVTSRATRNTTPGPGPGGLQMSVPLYVKRGLS